jgi:hypothetical protein
VSVSVEEYNNIWHTSPLIPQVTSVCLTLHTLRERIHILRKRPKDIPRSTHPRCVVVTSSMTDTYPLPHDRDCPQANLVLRGQVRDSYHPAKGYLHSYIFVSTSLQKSKLQKVNTEGKFLLACHLLRLL